MIVYIPKYIISHIYLLLKKDLLINKHNIS